MENIENLVGQTENVETTTEETPVKMFTQEEVNDIVGKAKATASARTEKRIRKEYEEHDGLIEVLEAGTGKKGVGELKNIFSEHYTKRGIQMPQKPTYSEYDNRILAEAEAKSIIEGGYEEVEYEVKRLSNKGSAGMSEREKAMFPYLVEHLENKRTREALAKIGVTEEEIESKEFKDFRAQFNLKVPVEDVYNIYRKTKPKKEIKTMGSMKNTDSTDNGVKDFYTPEEARRFTKADFDKDPALFSAVQKSMLKWKR